VSLTYYFCFLTDGAISVGSLGWFCLAGCGALVQLFPMAELEPKASIRWQPVSGISLGVTAVLALGVGYATRLHPYLAWLAGATLVGFGLFGADKLLARFNRRRVPEKALLLMILLGGFVGGWLGLFVFRHKLRSWLFWLGLTVGSVLHGTIVWFIWQHTGFR
jgi:uncharacterized membrane protein YsdA (DUF1294 family)